MVHLEIDAEDLPSHYQLLGIDVPGDATTESIDESGLPSDWRQQTRLTRARGDKWLRAAATALFRVPSAIVPEAANYLLNPAHVDTAGIAITSAVRAPFDARLMAFFKA